MYTKESFDMEFVCVIILITKIYYFLLHLQIENYIKYYLYLCFDISSWFPLFNFINIIDAV